MARADGPVVIEAAINGATSKTANPNVPRTPSEIAAEALACLGAGAAIVHSHNADYAVDGPRAAGLYLEAWKPVLAARPRVGLEDYAGLRQPSNTDLVAEVVRLAREIGRPVATPRQAAALLGMRE